VIGALVLLAAAAQSAEVRYEASRVAMGSKYTIVVYGASESSAAAAVNQALDEITRLDELLSNYKPQSELSQVNQQAARGPVRVTPEFFRFLQTCDEYRRQTGGAFDITLGRGRLSLDTRNFTVEFSTPEVKLDPGGIGKGVAVDRAIELLRAAGVRRAFVSAGMSTVYGLGAPPGEPGWKVLVRSPHSKDQAVLTVHLKDESLSTSATYEKGSHIVDPRPGGGAARGALSATALAPTATESDALSTAFFVLRREGTARYLRAHLRNRAFLCDPECSWVK
jgi:thiamine biosynthesis lipoprotein